MGAVHRIAEEQLHLTGRLRRGGAPAREAPSIPLERVHLALSRPRAAKRADLLALGALGGNRALARRLAVQRDDEEARTGLEKGGGTVEAVNPAVAMAGDISQGVAPFSSGGVTRPTYQWDQGANAPTDASAAQASLAGSTVGQGMNVMGLVLSSIALAEAKKDLAAATDPAARREAERRVKSAGLDVGVRAYGTAAGTVDVAARGLTLAGASAATVAGAAAGGVALPVTVVGAVRDLRKAVKAGKRKDALEDLLTSETANAADLKNAVERLQKVEQHLDHKVNRKRAKKDTNARALDDLEAQLAPLRKVGAPGHDARKQLRAVRKELQEGRDVLDAEIAAAEARHRKASDKLAEARTAEQAMKDALAEVAATASGGQVSLHLIRAYAFKKNERGIAKKAISFIGGLLGIGGGVAGLVASIGLAAGAAAGSAALMATPFGWGLAGAAAGVALGLGLYKAVRFFMKRWKRAQGTTGERLKQTLAFWRSVGESKREEYAAALFDYAEDATKATKQEEAHETITALGLAWADLKDNKAAAVKLIAAKMAS